MTKKCILPYGSLPHGYYVHAIGRRADGMYVGMFYTIGENVVHIVATSMDGENFDTYREISDCMTDIIPDAILADFIVLLGAYFIEYDEYDDSYVDDIDREAIGIGNADTYSDEEYDEDWGDD